ncbi:hypothetical protein CGZ80_06165 [Rhodopirellula sp. MGV]|nr:hypothetical protein CGZ80_06165 [Rhodopirellula sp. MGV]PNY36289.1 hypothetical protein C2E31_14415 [Rhodopirellula baltica]
MLQQQMKAMATTETHFGPLARTIFAGANIVEFAAKRSLGKISSNKSQDGFDRPHRLRTLLPRFAAHVTARADRDVLHLLERRQGIGRVAQLVRARP